MLDDDDTFSLIQVYFSDEANFHVSGKVNRHNCRIRGSKNPRFVIEHQRDSPKWNVGYGIMRDRIMGPCFFFFFEKTVTANTYLDILQLYAVPQLPEGTIYQQDEAPPHFANIVHTFLDEQLPARWIGRGLPNITWTARSPDLTQINFSCGGLLRIRSTWHENVIWQSYKKECMLLSTMSPNKQFNRMISKLSTSRTYIFRIIH